MLGEQKALNHKTELTASLVEEELLLDIHQFHIKNQPGIGGDCSRGSSGSITEVRTLSVMNPTGQRKGEKGQKKKKKK